MTRLIEIESAYRPGELTLIPHDGGDAITEANVRGAKGGTGRTSGSLRSRPLREREREPAAT
jgi:hypothetical protein